MKLSHHAQQQFTACIAILAVLLMFVAPVVSKSLMQHQMMQSNMAEQQSAERQMAAMPAMAQSAAGHRMMHSAASGHTAHTAAAGDTMPAMAHHHPMATMAQNAALAHHHQPAFAQPQPPMGHNMHHDMGMMGDMDDGMIACGYCDLLIHVPLMLWIFVPLLWLVTTLLRQRRAPEKRVPLPPHYSLSQPPRGPPPRLRFLTN